MCGWSALADGLPAGYTQVPWIESNGKQWIVTDYNLHVNNVAEKNGYVDEKVEVKIRPISATKYTGKDTVFGAFAKTQTNYQGSPDGVNGSFVLHLNDRNGTGDSSEILAWTAQWAYNGTSTFTIPHGEDCVLAMDGKLRKHYYDGVAKNTQAGSYDELSPLCFFGGKMPGSGVSTTADPDAARASSIRLYYAKIYNSSGELVFDAVPVRHDNATVYAKRFGLYDLVGDKYYPNNANSAPFTVPDEYCFTYTINRSDYASDEAAAQALVDVVASAKTKDFIKVGPGRYQLTEATGPLTLISGARIIATDGNPANTIIDANYATNCVWVKSGAANAELRGFTIMRGEARVDTSWDVQHPGDKAWVKRYVPRGGGVLLASGANGFLLSNCVVRACRSTTYSITPGGDAVNGYAAAIDASSTITMKDVDVRENVNRAIGDGDAAYQFYFEHEAVRLGSGGTVENCLFRTNVAEMALAKYHSWLNQATADFVTIGAATTFKNCVFEGNYPTNTLTHKTMLTDGAGHSAALRVSVAGSTVERCLFKGNKSYGGAGIVPSAKTTVKDCTFTKNRCLADYGRGGSGQVDASGCVFTGCDFDDEYSKTYACALEINSGKNGVVVSNSVIRNMKYHAENTHIFGMSGIGMTNVLCAIVDNTVLTHNRNFNTSQRGVLFDRCLIKNNTMSGSWNGMNDFRNGNNATSADSGVRLEYRGCLFLTNTIANLVSGKFGGTACEQIRVDACTFVKTTYPVYENALFDTRAAQCASLIDGVAFQELVGIHNTCFYNDNKGPFQINWGTDYAASIANCACSCADSVMAANASNLTSVNPKFRDPAHGNYSLKGSSPLRGKGVKSDWMDQTADLGEGFEYATGAYTIHPCGETHTVGARVAIKKPKMRAPGAKTNIGAFGYHPAGAALLLK